MDLVRKCLGQMIGLRIVLFQFRGDAICTVAKDLERGKEEARAIGASGGNLKAGKDGGTLAYFHSWWQTR